MEEAPDYGAIAQKKNAKSLFESYLKLFDMMTEMEPQLFQTAVQILKRTKGFDFDKELLKKMKRLYPDLVPNVFLRLQKMDLEPEELYQRNLLAKEVKESWR